MRSLLLASLALTTTLWQPVADACGGYDAIDRGPAVFRVTTHTTGTYPHGARSFVLLYQAGADDKRQWHRVGRTTDFDPAQTSDVPDLKDPRRFTLLGPNGSKHVSSAALTVFARSPGSAPMSALELTRPDRNSLVAIEGTFKKATWSDLEHVAMTNETKALAQSWNVAPELMTVRKVQGTNIQVVSGFRLDQMEQITLVSSTGQASYGTPVGAIELDGKRYVLFDREGVITPVAA